MQLKRIGLAFLLSTVASSASATWYESKVAEVTTRIDAGAEYLYVRTDSNPNPANCASSWAGARWGATGPSMNLAASIALAAKATSSGVRFEIKDSGCDAYGWPIMTWIQGR